MDDLQTLWRSAQPAADTQALPDQQIDQMIHQKSRSTFEKFRRTVFWEMLFNGLFTLGCIYYVLVSEFRAFPFTMGAILMLVLGFLGWQLRFYQRLRRHPFEANVHYHLQLALALLKKYVLHYKILFGVMLPITAVLSFGMGVAAGKEGLDLPFYELPQHPWLAGLLVVAVLGLSLAAVHFQLKYLYQHKINRMQQLVDELEAVS